MATLLQKNIIHVEENGAIETPRNKPESINRVENQSIRLIADAQKIFGKGFVQNLKARGMEWVESRREGMRVFDADGKSYLDCYSSAGTYNLGRKNLTIVKALKRAIQETDQGNFVMISKEKAELAEKLAKFTPHTLDCVLYTVVRGEAVDAACKLARGYTGRSELITVDGGWYGQTGFAMSLSERSDKKYFGSLIPDCKTILFNDISAARKAITKRTAAVILEPVQVENNCRTADKAYLQELRLACDRAGALLIFDETQTGFGRTGEKFAADYFGVLPHIMLIGEALSGGLFPMGAMIFTSRIKKFFDAHPLIHLLTFGGHDVGCRVASAALDVYEQTRPWKNTGRQGEKLKQKLEAIIASNSKIKSVNGIGLLLALRLEDAQGAAKFCRSLMNNGVLVKTGEVAKDSVIIRPPLILTDQDVDEIAAGIERASRSSANED